jgi:hypothetical protein
MSVTMSTSTPDISPIQVRPVAAEATIVTFGVSDPEVLLALSEYPEGPARTNFLVTALKVGVLSLKAARGTLDADNVRREGDRLMEQLTQRLNGWREQFEDRVTGSLSHYFDPKQGLFMERVDRLTRQDGELSGVVKQQVREAEQSLAKVFDQFVGENSTLLQLLDPTGDNRLVVQLKSALDGVVQAQNAAILDQFSLDNKSSALVRFLSELTERHGNLNKAMSENMQAVVAEFSLDKPDSALSRLVGQVDATQRRLHQEMSLDSEGSSLQRLYRLIEDHQRQMVEHGTRLSEQVAAAVAVFNARKQEAERGTRHGLEFEAALGERLRELVSAQGDIVEDTGATTGLVPRSKVGDHVITLGPDKQGAGAKIVLEAKQSGSYDLAASLAEADEARRNRGAGVCVFVHSTRTAKPGIPTFARYGNDVLVQWHPEEESSDVWLQAALAVAAALSTRAAQHDSKDAKSFEKIDRSIEALIKQVEGFEEITTSANSVKSAAGKILGRAEIMKDELTRLTQLLQAEFVKVKARGEEDK